MNYLNHFKGLFTGSCKLDLKMKITAILMFVTLLQVHASSYSQKTKISLHLSDVSVEEVLNEIESLTEFKFFVNTKQIDLERQVTINENRKRVSQILEKLFDNTHITFEILDRQIILNPTTSKPLIGPKANANFDTPSGSKGSVRNCNR